MSIKYRIVQDGNGLFNIERKTHWLHGWYDWTCSIKTLEEARNTIKLHLQDDMKKILKNKKKVIENCKI